MKTLHMMVGLPRSGKSTIARKMGFPIVEPDAIRKVLHGTPWRPEAEPMVWAIAKIMVQALFEAGHKEVVIDGCFPTFKLRSQFYCDDWEIEYHVVKTKAHVCKKRAIKNKQEYLLPVIERMTGNFDPIYETIKR